LSRALPSKLYTASDLLDGYKPNDPDGFTASWDFGVFRQYVVDGAETPKSLHIRQRQAEHDAYMAEALKTFLSQDPPPKLAGLMGGHGLTRAAPAYQNVARLTKRLAEEGYLVVSGGGPGAMEAAHVGATFAGEDASLDQALKILSQVPAPPDLTGIVTPTGEIAPGREKDLELVRVWMNAALDAKALAPANPAESLAIPTWRYGQEPTIPFATHYAKYFQNSIREETLILNSRAGLIYAQGGGGTVREVFEDAERNYYVPDAKSFTPMIFFDADGFWQHDAEISDGKVTRPGIKLDETIVRLFRFARARAGDADACLAKVRFTVDFQEIVDVLDAHSGMAQQNMIYALSSEPLKIAGFAINRPIRVG
jgi:predicted Rossmann-fold nucleotide-binding protein